MTYRVYKSWQRAEDIACRYLRSQGYEIIDRNWRCRFGEIDIVARDGSTLAFVEVRFRTGKCFGGPEASLTARKKERLVMTARAYLGQTRAELPARFDFVAVRQDDVTLYPDAFQIEEEWSHTY